jgi:hypothetical protein
MDGDTGDEVGELFGVETVILTEPRRSIVRRYHGPKLELTTPDGTVLGHLHERGKHAYALHDLADRPRLRIALVSKASSGRARFQLADGQDRPIGEVHTQGRVARTRLLHIRGENGENGALRLTRRAPMRKWLVQDTTDYQLGLVTGSTARSLDGLQRYTVELDPSTGAERARLIVGAVVCLQVIRRWSDGPDVGFDL